MFQSFLIKGGLSEDTVADMVCEGITSAHGLYFVYQDATLNLNMLDTKNFARVVTMSDHFLTVTLNQGAARLASEVTLLAQVAMCVPELMIRERNAFIVSLDKTVMHASEQFPADVTSNEQKQEYSVGVMISMFNTARPGVLKPSSRPANKILHALHQYALSKAGMRDNLFALCMNTPDFGKLAMRAGASEESVGGGDSTLVQKKEGGELCPKSIGTLAKMWTDFLRYAQAMMSVKMPDGTVYGTEAAFMVLEECFSEYASQRPTVAAVASALTKGWRTLCDELVSSNDSFLSVCKSMKRSGVWLESTETKTNPGEDSRKEVKKLRAELQRIKKPLYTRFNDVRTTNPRFTGRPAGADTPAGDEAAKTLIPSNKPCFDYFANKKCQRNPCPFRHNGEPPAHNPAKK